MLLHPTTQNRTNVIQTISSILQSAAASLSDEQSRIIYIAICFGHGIREPRRSAVGIDGIDCVAIFQRTSFILQSYPKQTDT